jgi:hypothetical protein
MAGDYSDSGSGSLRDAVSQSNRIVVFEVGGVIEISSRIVVKSKIYIAGQTAPGDVRVFVSSPHSNAADMKTTTGHHDLRRRLVVV